MLCTKPRRTKCVRVWIVHTHCKGRSFWRKTEPQTAQSPLRQSNGWPRHLSPDCQRRNPGKLSQRTQTSSSSREKQEKKQQQKMRNTIWFKNIYYLQAKHVKNVRIPLIRLEMLKFTMQFGMERKKLTSSRRRYSMNSMTKRPTATSSYLHDLCDLLPLLLGRVGAGGVVCAGVEDKDGVFWSFLLRNGESDLIL